MKKILIIMSVVMVALTGCLKDTPPNDFSTLKPIVELPSSGFENFNTDALSLSGTSQDVSFTVNLASVNPADKDIPVTLKIDATALAAYNATLPANAQYKLFPDSTFSFTKKTGVIKAGKRLDTFHIIFYPNKIDPSSNYILPVSIADASGQIISGNFGTHYYHVIGNPLAGSYIWLGQRWNAPALDTTQPPATTPRNNVLISASPLGGTTLLFPTVYLSQNSVNANIALDFTNTAGTLTNFKASLYDPAGNVSGSFAVVTSPILVGFKIVGSASTNFAGSVFRFYSAYSFNGNVRVTIDNFTKQ